MQTVIDVLDPERMFRGKCLPAFMRRYAPLYRRLVETHTAEKVYKVYDYFFAFMSRMQWGQWMVLTKVCPDTGMRQLFYWVVECIYQSDLTSQFRFEYHDLEDDPSRREVRIVCVEPTAEQLGRWGWTLPTVTRPDGEVVPARRYSLIDWFGRLRKDPGCLPDVDPAWIMLSVEKQWGNADEDTTSAADGTEES